jgi:hypothetical protein
MFKEDTKKKFTENRGKKNIEVREPYTLAEVEHFWKSL